MDDRTLSRRLAYVLRHAPESVNLRLEDGGWVDVTDLLGALSSHGVALSREQLDRIVSTSDKQRFAFDPSGGRIRANQGHSISVDLHLTLRQPPAVLYHGTVAAALDSIRGQGLLPQGRHHVHLSVDVRTARSVGRRRGPPVVLEVDSARMAGDGLAFYRSDNGVWLTVAVPARYLSFPGGGASAGGHGRNRQDGAMHLDVSRIRASFPALREGVARFDGPGGSQVPTSVAHAVADAMCVGMANRGTVTAAERRADDIVIQARAAVADLLGCAADGVVFGRSMTQLTYDISRALAKQWSTADEVVVTRLDHDANVRPWVQAAAAVGATVRWAEFDRDSAELPVSAISEHLGARTRVVAVTGASNLLGTRPQIAEIATAAREVGALVYVDGVHLTPHAPIDVRALGVDFFACSPYKFFGPHHGVVVADPSLLESLEPDKLTPSSNKVPERFELGTLPYEMLAGTRAAVDFIADLVPGTGDRRTRVLTSMAAAEEHESRLFHRLLDGLEALDDVTVHGKPPCRTPTALFTVGTHPPGEVHRTLAARGVNAPAGTFYAVEASRWLGMGDAGAVRAGLAPYTDDEDVDRLLAGVADLCR